MKLTTALAAILLAAPVTIANPLPQDNVWTPPEMNLTTVSLEVEGSSIPFNTIYVSAHHGRLWLNVLDPDAECDSHTTSQIFTPLATFLTDNTTNTLRLYHGATPELSWQQVYVNHTTSGILYVDDVAAPVPTDGWPTEVSGWTMTRPMVGGQVYMLYQGKKLWACDTRDWWSLETAEWFAFPMGTQGCVQVDLRVVRKEPADECVYTGH